MKTIDIYGYKLIIDITPGSICKITDEVGVWKAEFELND